MKSLLEICKRAATLFTFPVVFCLLSEVFFRHELKAADYVTKLPKGKHSTKGIGMTFPDPEATQTIGKGVKVPLGKPVQSSERSSLLYNEFIVYDVAQINIKYLLQVNFDFKF